MNYNTTPGYSKPNPDLSRDIFDKKPMETNYSLNSSYKTNETPQTNIEKKRNKLFDDPNPNHGRPPSREGLVNMTTNSPHGRPISRGGSSRNIHSMGQEPRIGPTIDYGNRVSTENGPPQ